MIKPEIKAIQVHTLWVFNLTMKKKDLPFYLVQWLPNMSVHSEALGLTAFQVPPPGDTDSVGLGWGPRLCILQAAGEILMVCRFENPELSKTFHISMTGLPWGDKLLLAELGPEHRFLTDSIWYCPQSTLYRCDLSVFAELKME